MVDSNSYRNRHSPFIGQYCSTTCKSQLITPPELYINTTHKGGLNSKQPKTFEDLLGMAQKKGKFHGVIDLKDKQKPLTIEPY